MTTDAPIPAAAPAPLTPEQIQTFWREFAQREQALYALPLHGFVEAANELMHSHASDLSLEVCGQPEDAQRELIVTAHGAIEQFPNVMALVAAAPPLAHHHVTAFRARALDAEFAIQMQDFSLGCTDVKAGLYAVDGLVGLALQFIKPIPMDMVDHAKHMSFILMDHVLGEYDFAVRVGPVDFVEQLSDEHMQHGLLSELPAAFDHFWRQTLGHTGDWLDPQQSPWTLLRGESDDGSPIIVRLNQGANAVATRADLMHALTLEFSLDDDGALQRAYDVEDALELALSPGQQGLQAFSHTQGDVRHAVFYVSDPHAARQLAEQACAAHGAAGTTLTTDFDPSWARYRVYLSN